MGGGRAEGGIAHGKWRLVTIFRRGRSKGFASKDTGAGRFCMGTHTREKEERGDTCFGVAKIQGYVNFACYKTGGH